VSKVRVICPNHGIIQEIEMACTWLGRPPIPEIDYAFCPKCGAKTVIERDKQESYGSYTFGSTWSQKDNNDYKEREIKLYREKYKKEFGLE
jgi:hypothetical protein